MVMSERELYLLAILFIIAILQLVLNIPRWRREERELKRLMKEFNDSLTDEQREALKHGKTHRR